MNEPPDLILASASPRRRELLERVGLRLEIRPADIDESPRPDERPAEYVRRMANEKAAAALAAQPASSRDVAIGGGVGLGVDIGSGGGGGGGASLPLLAADTTVIVDGAILGKPADEKDARLMLERLAGRRHEVTTAYRIVHRGREVDRSVTTTVAFRLLDPGELAGYLAGNEWRGKAGAYAIQGVAAAFVTEVRGSLTNVVGLPLAEVLADLRALEAIPRYPPAQFPDIA